jgi:hypothetical protein
VAIYNLGFSEKLIEAAQLVFDDDGDEFDKLQTVLYLCHLSCEITLKALLEKAGKPIKDIIACAHDFDKIFQPFFVEVEINREVGNNIYRWIKSGGIGCEQTKDGIFEPTIRTMLTDKRTSQYPSHLRYAGDHISAYPPQELIKASKILLNDALKYYDNIRLAPQSKGGGKMKDPMDRPMERGEKTGPCPNCGYPEVIININI